MKKSMPPSRPRSRRRAPRRRRAMSTSDPTERRKASGSVRVACAGGGRRCRWTQAHLRPRCSRACACTSWRGYHVLAKDAIARDTPKRKGCLPPECIRFLSSSPTRLLARPSTWRLRLPLLPLAHLRNRALAFSSAPLLLTTHASTSPTTHRRVDPSFYNKVVVKHTPVIYFQSTR